MLVNFQLAERHYRSLSASQWLAAPARFGLVRGSLIPPQELRMASRHRCKLDAIRANQINRPHKPLTALPPVSPDIAIVQHMPLKRDHRARSNNFLPATD